MNEKDGWIVVPGWEGFQHPDVARNKHGIPPWIRVYTELTSKPEFIELSFHQRGVLISIWVEYARSRSQLRAKRNLLSRQLGANVYQRDLDALNHAGFIDFSASKPQAENQQLASLEERREEEKHPLTPSNEGEPHAQTPRARGTNPRAKDQAANTHTCPTCHVHFKAKTLLDEHVYTTHDGPEPEHWKAEPSTQHLPIEDPELPPPEERHRLAAELRAQLLGAQAAAIKQAEAERAANGHEPDLPPELTA